MEWVEFSDIIGIAIVIYVAVLAHYNVHMKRDVKLGMLFSGAALAILYVFDMSWYVVVYKWPDSSHTDFILNFITCIVYLMIPLGLSTFFTIYTHRRKRVRHYIGLLVILIIAVIDIVNIFIPILFRHEDKVMYFEPLAIIMHILCFVAFIIMLVDMVMAMSFDYEDIFLGAFVGLTMFIGLIASWVNYDLKTLWVALGISYLLMYLAIAELYNKKDVITGLPNRNAYEKYIAHIKDNYKSIMMIDMNELKHYNDTMGHEMGDKYIYATARTLAEAFEGYGMLYRIGGDEFCIISRDSGKELAKIAQKLLDEGRCYVKYGDFPINFAYGIGERENGDIAAVVLNKADQEMYINKEQRNR